MVVLLAAIPIAYYVGGVSGFGKGYDCALFERSANARQTIVVLRKLRAGETKAPIEWLESELDNMIILNHSGREGDRSLFNAVRLIGVESPGLIDKLASSAVTYRAEFPSTAPPALKTYIDGALAELATRVRE